jgi:hypothetical protein
MTPLGSLLLGPTNYDGWGGFFLRRGRGGMRMQGVISIDSKSYGMQASISLGIYRRRDEKIPRDRDDSLPLLDDCDGSACRLTRRL